MTLKTGISLLALGLLAVSAPAPLEAHIVPAERLHPVTESYRRLVFSLNLNPVPWELVRADLDVVQTSQLSPSALEALANGPNAESAVERRAATQALFEEATRSVAELLVAALEDGTAKVNDHSYASAALNLARQLWSSFENEVEATDVTAFRRLGECWLQMSSSLGSPGILGLGAVPADPEIFRTEAEEVIAYVSEHFGSPQTPSRGRLAPLPLRSETFDERASVPVKLPPGHDINKQLPRPRQVLNMAERGVNEAETTLIALGDMAFDSSFIFGEPARSLAISCNTCHNKSITNPGFFIPGLSSRPGGMDVSNSFFAPHANNAHFDPLDIPDLRGIRFTAPYGRNGRFDSLREFTRNVIVNEFNGPEPEPLLLDGMMAYMLEFDFLSTPLLAEDGTLRPDAPKEALRGEQIFHRPYEAMGNRSCATCHVPSDHFLDRRRHDIGTVHGTQADSRDRALDTPTLLSSRYSAPYFHDGSAPTLEAVVEWFDERYGLGLSSEEQSHLTTYLELVGDGVDGYEDTMFTLEAEMEEFSFFLSAFEFLDARGRRDLIATTFKTIALELRAHKWDVQDSRHLPVLEGLAVLMDEASAANRRGDEEGVRERVAAYRQLYQENAEVLR
jgi:cytochrome c peroxidase